MSDEPNRMGRRASPAPIGDVLTDIDADVEKYRLIKKKANSLLKKLGVPAARRPDMDEMPMLNGPVSEMTSAELGDAQGDFAGWEAYLGPLTAEAESDASEAKALLGYLAAKLKKQATGPQAGKADIVKTDSRYIDVDTEYLLAKRVAAQLRAALDGQERQRKVCSRYVEIRTREIDSHTRTENVQQRRHGAPRFRRTPRE